MAETATQLVRMVSLLAGSRPRRSGHEGAGSSDEPPAVVARAAIGNGLPGVDGGNPRRRSAAARAARTIREVAASLLVAALLAVTAGCGASSDTEDLRLSLRETRTAVASTELAIDLLQRGRTTKAAARVTVGDMVDQIGDAQQRLVDAPGDTPAQRELRRRCQIVVTDALVTVQNSEDALSATGDRSGVGAELPRALSAVDAALVVVGER